MLRFLGCTLPIEVWMLSKEIPPRGPLYDLLARQGVTLRSTAFLDDNPELRAVLMGSGGFQFKSVSLMFSSFEEVLLLDADVSAVQDPSSLFDVPVFKNTGLVLWKDLWLQRPRDFKRAKTAFNLTWTEIRRWAGGNSGRYPGAYRDPLEASIPPSFAPNAFLYDRVHAEHLRMS